MLSNIIFCSIQNWLHITFVLFMFIFRSTLLLSVLRLLSIFSSLWPSSALRMLSSANRRWFNLSPSMFIPLLSQLILREISSSAALKSLGDIVSPCRTPLLMRNSSLSLCRWMVAVALLYVHHIYEFDVSVVDTLLLKICYHCLRFNAVKGLCVIHKSNAQGLSVFTGFLN